MSEHYKGDTPSDSIPLNEMSKYYHRVNKIEHKLLEIKRELLHTSGKCDDRKLESMLFSISNEATGDLI